MVESVMQRDAVCRGRAMRADRRSEAHACGRELIAKDREIRVGRVDEEKSPLQHGTSVTLLA